MNVNEVLCPNYGRHFGTTFSVTSFASDRCYRMCRLLSIHSSMDKTIIMLLTEFNFVLKHYSTTFLCPGSSLTKISKRLPLINVSRRLTEDTVYKLLLLLLQISSNCSFRYLSDNWSHFLTQGLWRGCTIYAIHAVKVPAISSVNDFLRPRATFRMPLLIMSIPYSIVRQEISDNASRKITVY